MGSALNVPPKALSVGTVLSGTTHGLGDGGPLLSEACVPPPLMRPHAPSGRGLLSPHHLSRARTQQGLTGNLLEGSMYTAFKVCTWRCQVGVRKDTRHKQTHIGNLGFEPGL